MKKEEKQSRRDALKRMSNSVMAIAVASMLPNMNAMANNTNPDTVYCDASYRDISNYRNYYNYNDYSNYRDYKNYNNYQDCERK